MQKWLDMSNRVQAMSILCLSSQVWERVSQVKSQIVIFWSERLIMVLSRDESPLFLACPPPPMSLLLCGWVDSSLGSIVQRSVSGMSYLQMPALSRLHERGLAEMFCSVFYSGPIKTIIAATRLFILFFSISKSLSVQWQSIGLANLECMVSPLLYSWGFLTHGAWSLRSSGLVSAVKVRWMWNLNPHEYHYALEFSQILHVGTFSDPLQGYSFWKIK